MEKLGRMVEPLAAALDGAYSSSTGAFDGGLLRKYDAGYFEENGMNVRGD